MEDHLLESWRVKIGGWRWLHYHAMHHYKKINARFTYTSIALSTLAGAGGFTTAGGASTEDSGVMKLLRFYSGYIIGAVNMILSIMSSFQRFGKAAEKTELHASAALQYAMLYRSIETELSLSKERRNTNFLTNVLQDMDRLLAQSPQIPQKIIDNFNELYPNVEYKPDVCSGMGSSSIAKLVPSDIVKKLFIRTTNDNCPSPVATSSSSVDMETGIKEMDI